MTGYVIDSSCFLPLVLDAKILDLCETNLHQ